VKLDFSGLKILVIGDPMIDVYQWGHVDRISPEAPVPVFVKDCWEQRRGGADNVLANLLALGVDAIGDYPSTKWIQKHRFMVGHQQIFRVDYEFDYRVDKLRGDEFYKEWDGRVWNAIVISDYAKGYCSEARCQQAIASGLPVIVDPKGKDWSKYFGCAVICPNQLEVNGHEGFNVIEKLGAKGLRHNGVTYASTARHVYDVTGAGDTVTAVIAACVAKGIDLPTACKLANLAAGFVVGEVGTTVCPLEKLCELAS
jgi:D-beta-D-heptose 7-phosphate kinase/D-beta-D-heptose 1-phosphate adenosyltransferase